MLPVETVRVLSILTVVSLAGGLALFARHGNAFGGRASSVAARAPVARVSRTAWEVLVAAPLLFIFLHALVPGLLFAAPWKAAFPGDEAVQLAGFGMWGAGGLLALAAVRALGRFMVVDIAVSEDHEVVTRGPYSRIRHPAYTSVMLMAFGAALFYLDGLMTVVAVLTVILATHRARKEEALLSSTPPVADAYRKYMTRTGRFLPRRR